MAGPSVLGAIEMATESAFAETSTTFATDRIPVLGMVNTSGLVWAKEEPGRVEQYLQGGSQHVLMGQSGSFEMEIDLTGHEATTAGSPTLTLRETLLGYVFGNAALSASASTTFTGGTATVPTTTASGTFSAGSLMRTGVLGDGRGNGQFHAIATHVTTTATLLTGTDVAVNAADVMYPTAMIYPSSTPTTGLNGSIGSLRFRLLTNGLQYACHGCAITSVAYSNLNTGGRPKIKFTVTVARWAAVSATFPSQVTSSTANPSPVAAGSFFFAPVATATRALKVIRGFELNYSLGITPLMGPGGVGAYQTIVGFKNTYVGVKVLWLTW